MVAVSSGVREPARRGMGYTATGAGFGGQGGGADAGARRGAGPLEGLQQIDVIGHLLAQDVGVGLPLPQQSDRAAGRLAHGNQLGRLQQVGQFLRGLEAVLPRAVGVVQPGLGELDVGIDPVFAVDVFQNGVGRPVAEQAEHRRGNGRIAHGAVGIKHAVNVAPALGDHQFPDIPADVGIHVFLERHVVRVRAGDAAGFGVHHLLAGFGGERLRAGNVVGDGGARRQIIMERQHIHGVGERLHVALVGHADGHRRLLVQFVQRRGNQAGDLDSLLLLIARRTGGVVIRFV